MSWRIILYFGLAIGAAIFIAFALRVGWIEIGVGSGGKGTEGGVGSLTFQYRIVPPQPVTLITEPDDGIAPILSSIESASSSIDMVMYELEDEKVEGALAAAAGRGVAVRVLLNNGLYGKGATANQSAFSYLQSNGVQVEWSPSSFALTHQKTLIIDAKQVTDASRAVIMTFNLTPKYYPTARDFGIVDSDSADVLAIEDTFNADWNSANNEKSVSNPPSAAAEDAGENQGDLVWSPGSKQILLAMIASASSSLEVTSEELADTDSIKALAAAAGRGVHVQLLMTDNKKWHSAFTTLISAGAQVRIYPARKKLLYIHEKVIIADEEQVFIGSQNLTTTSLEKNRELGIFVSTPIIVKKLETVFANDWRGAVAPVLQ